MTETYASAYTTYTQLKGQYPDSIMLIRLGDFIEAFDDDARALVEELDWILVFVKAGGKQRVPMAGVPYYRLQDTVKALNAKGLTVAVAEQTGAWQ